jgi:type I restriction-modification system DNA methylase subunit
MTAEPVEVTSADIARLSGVRPSAVSNWRRRHGDFPSAVGGTEKSPTFDLAEVTRWLRQQGRSVEIAPDERLWQAFDSVRGIMSTAEALVMVGIFLLHLHRNPEAPRPQDRDGLQRAMTEAEHAMRFGNDGVVAGLSGLLSPFDLSARQVNLLHAAAKAADMNGPRTTFGYLMSRFLDGPASSGFTATPPELADLMLDLAEPARGAVLDPACGTGGFMLAAMTRGYQRVLGQELNASLARLAGLRLAFASQRTADPQFDIHDGDALRQDAYPLRSAHAVVCNPPFADRNWGHDELSLDGRWEYGVPPRLESELAWVQHALAHTAPAGTTVMLMPPAAAARPTGRRIRAALVQRHALRAVITLPPRVAAQHALPLQLWVLQPPGEHQQTDRILFVDSSHRGPESGESGTASVRKPVRDLIVRAWSEFRAAPEGFTDIVGSACAVPLATVLNDEVDLTPKRYLRMPPPGGASRDDLAARRADMERLISDLTSALPPTPPMAPAEDRPTRFASLQELSQMGVAFIRRTREVDSVDAPRVQVRIVRGVDVAHGRTPSERDSVPLDPLRLVREGDVLVPAVARRLTARVATREYVGAYSTATVFLIRVDQAIIDPWFLAAYLSSSDGEYQATHMNSPAGDRTRFDPRRVRIPLLPIATQQHYGRMFRAIADFEDVLRSVHHHGQALVQDLTNSIASNLPNIGTSSVDQDALTPGVDREAAPASSAP